MDSIKKRYETPDLEELESNFFLAEELNSSDKEQGIGGGDEGGAGVEDDL